MPLKTFFIGPALKITSWSEREDNINWFEHWLSANVSKKDLRSVAIRLERYCKNGLPRKNKQKFRHLESKLCELKPTQQIRLLGGEFKNEFCIVYALIKKDEKLNRQLINNAQALLEKCHNERRS